MDIRPSSLASPLPLPPQRLSSLSSPSGHHGQGVELHGRPATSTLPPQPTLSSYSWPRTAPLRHLFGRAVTCWLLPPACRPLGRLLPWAGRCCCIRPGLAWRGPQLAAAGRGQAPAQPRLAAPPASAAGSQPFPASLPRRPLLLSVLEGDEGLRAQIGRK